MTMTTSVVSVVHRHCARCGLPAQERPRSNSTSNSHDTYVRAFCRDERGAVSESTKLGETTGATDTPIPVSRSPLPPHACSERPPWCSSRLLCVLCVLEAAERSGRWW